ncbi:hypothetical protein BH23THE1_BH23THE1_24300 [soil metagenome]
MRLIVISSTTSVLYLIGQILKSYVNSPLITKFLGDKMLPWIKHSFRSILSKLIKGLINRRPLICYSNQGNR